MDNFNLVITLKGEKLVIWSFPESALPVEWSTTDILSFVKQVFLKRMTEENPLMIHTVFMTTLERFIQIDKIDKIMFSKENNGEIEFYFNISDDISPVMAFSVSADNKDITLKQALMSLLRDAQNDEDTITYLSFFVFSWMSPEQFMNAEEQWLQIAFDNFEKLLKVELVSE